MAILGHVRKFCWKHVEFSALACLECGSSTAAMAELAKSSWARGGENLQDATMGQSAGRGFNHRGRGRGRRGRGGRSRR